MNGRSDRYDQPTTTYDANSNSYRFEYDPETDPDVVTLTALAVAELLDVDPLELPPVGERVDPDDLASAIRLRDEGNASVGNVSFPVANCRVTVTKDAIIQIEILDEQT